MKKNVLIFGVAIIFIVLMAACAIASPYDEQIQLGYKLIDEGKYEEAILAFNAAIEIDAKLPRAYVGLSDTYVTRLDDNTLADIQDALRRGYEQDEVVNNNAIVEAIIRLADILVEQGKADLAKQLLDFGYGLTRDDKIWEAIEGIGKSSEETSYYDSLNDEQKQLLGRLETALRTVDYEAVYNIQRLSEFHALCDDIPGNGFWYYPDPETSIRIYGASTEGHYVEIYIGKDGNGRLHDGRLFERNNQHLMRIVDYSGGKANGQFIVYSRHFDNSAEWDISHRSASDGIVYEDGGIIFSWHDWPTGAL